MMYNVGSAFNPMNSADVSIFCSCLTTALARESSRQLWMRGAYPPPLLECLTNNVFQCEWRSYLTSVKALHEKAPC